MCAGNCGVCFPTMHGSGIELNVAIDNVTDTSVFPVSIN